MHFYARVTSLYARVTARRAADDHMAMYRELIDAAFGIPDAERVAARGRGQPAPSRHAQAVMPKPSFGLDGVRQRRLTAARAPLRHQHHDKRWADPRDAGQRE